MNALRQFSAVIATLILNCGVVLANGDLIVDETDYGVVYGGATDDTVELAIDFSIAMEKMQGDSQRPSRTGAGAIQDVVIEFTGAFNEVFNSSRRFRVRLNGSPIGVVDDFNNNQDTSKSFVVDRDLFADSDNVIVLEPFGESIRWGIKNLKATVVPKIPLMLGVLDSNQYGFSETPLPRYTSAKFIFDLASVDTDLMLTMTGYDQDFANETEVFINGDSLGYLNLSGNEQYGDPTSFSIAKNKLIVGSNQIEVFQRKLSLFQSRNWAVTNILLSELRPDLAITSFEVTAENVRKNRPFEVVGTVFNLGSANAVSARLRYYLSEDETITPNDTRLTANSIVSGINSNTSKGFSIDVSTASVNTGTYLGACIDSVALEVNVDNNCSTGILLEGKEPVVQSAIILLLDD